MARQKGWGMLRDANGSVIRKQTNRKTKKPALGLINIHGLGAGIFIDVSCS